MITSGIAFVGTRGHRQSARMGIHPQTFSEKGVINMCIEKLAQRVGFALAALAIVIAVSATVEYLPLSNALAR
jgi:hypothetical protein